MFSNWNTYWWFYRNAKIKENSVRFFKLVEIDEEEYDKLIRRCAKILNNAGIFKRKRISRTNLHKRINCLKIGINRQKD